MKMTPQLCGTGQASQHGVHCVGVWADWLEKMALITVTLFFLNFLHPQPPAFAHQRINSNTNISAFLSFLQPIQHLPPLPHHVFVHQLSPHSSPWS